MFFALDDYDGTWESYIALFDAAPPGSLLGDGSTFYAASEHEVRARQRILAHYPHVKLIFIVRDPIARIEASFRELHHSGPHFGEDCPFELDAAFARFPSFIEDTKYWERLANYRDHVDDDQIRVIFAEDLFAEPQRVMARCFEFLGVAAKFDLPKLGLHLNRGTDKLYDTRAVREMRSLLLHPETADALARVRPETQDQFLEKLGLRRRFNGGPLSWSEAAREQVVEALQDDIARLLEFYGKPFDFWPRFAAACAGDRSSLEGQRIP